MMVSDDQLPDTTKVNENKTADPVESKAEQDVTPVGSILITGQIDRTDTNITLSNDSIVVESQPFQIDDAIVSPVDSSKTDVEITAVQSVPEVNSTVLSGRGVSIDGSCLFILSLPNRNIPSITYSTNCDFGDHDMYTVNCVPDSFACGLLCAGDSKCTHFTFIAKLNGGTCRLKKAPNSGGAWASSIESPSPYVCGYIGKRAFANVLLGLCLSLDINTNVL